MQVEYIYKKAVVTDFLKISELDRKAWKENNNSKFIPDGEHAWRIWVENALVFIAEKNHKILGAILAFPCMSGEVCIHKVFVEENERGKNIGTKLFEILLNEIDKNKLNCFLTVDPDNKNAIKLYEKWGFTNKIFIKGYYREEEDRYVLSRFFEKQ